MENIVTDPIRCRFCKLNQYPTGDGNCRRCHKPLRDQVKVEPPSAEPPHPASLPQPILREYHYWLPVVFLYLRLRLGISQAELARRMRAPRTYINRSEMGAVNIETRNFGRWCHTLDIEMGVVLKMCECLMGQI